MGRSLLMISIDMLLNNVPRLAFSISDSSFHPKLSFEATAPVHLPNTTTSSCTLGLSLSLPDDVFVDPNELHDVWSQAGPEWHVNPEVVDLERAVIPYPNGVGLELDLAYGPFEFNEENSKDWRLEEFIPLHARYPAPSEQGWNDVHVLAMSYGPEALVWARWRCNEEPKAIAAWSKDDLWPVTIHDPILLRLPTGKHEHQPAVETWTTVTICLAFAWVVYKLFRVKGSRVKTV